MRGREREREKEDQKKFSIEKTGSRKIISLKKKKKDWIYNYYTSKTHQNGDLSSEAKEPGMNRKRPTTTYKKEKHSTLGRFVPSETNPEHGFTCWME